MKRLWTSSIPILVLAAGAAAIAVPAHAQPAYVQSGYGECYPATTCNVDFGVPGIPGVEVTPGNLIVVTVRTDNTNGPVNSVTSQPGNQTCSLDRRHLQGGTSFWLEVWSCPNATGGDATVTVNVDGPADAMRITLDEYSGIATSSHVNAVASGDSDTGQPNCADAGTITTTVTNVLIHSTAGANHNNDAYIWTPGSGYTIHELGGDPLGADKMMTQHRVATTAGNYNTEMCNINDYVAAVAVAYKPAGTPDTVPPAAPAGLSVK